MDAALSLQITVMHTMVACQDKIAKLPAELVPEPIRHIVPTIDSTRPIS